MEKNNNDIDMFNEGTILRLKSTFDTFKTQFFKEYHNTMFDANRKNMMKGEESTKELKSTTKEYNDPEINTTEIEKTQKKKSVTFAIETITLYDKNFSELYSKFSFKINWQKEYFLIEFYQNTSEVEKIAKYKLEIPFKKVMELIVIKNSNIIVIMFEQLKAVKEVVKKKHPMSSKIDLNDLDIFKGNIMQQNKNYLSIHFSTENFTRLFNPKIQFLERIKSVGIKKTEGSFNKSQNIDNTSNKIGNLQLKEIINSKDLIDVSKFENYLKNSSAEENGEMLKKVSYSKLHDKIQTSAIHCPIYSCFETLNSVPALKNHVSAYHKELLDSGIEILPNGKIKYNEDVLRNVLMVCKVVPSFVRMCIKKGENLAEKLQHSNK